MSLPDPQTILYPDPPPNPAGGRTLIVDARDAGAYPRPSVALGEAGPDDMVFVRPGLYEDKIFVVERPILLVGAGRDAVQIYSRRSGPIYLQRVPSGRVSGLTFRYIGSDQHSALNVLDSTCTIAQCRATEAVLSGVVLYGPDCRPTFIDNEVCYNRESGIFVFGGAAPRVAGNDCFGNHHFGLAARDAGSAPEFVRNVCRENWLSGILLFGETHAMVLDNVCRDNQHWGLVMTPDSATTPGNAELAQANELAANPRGTIQVTNQPLNDIGR